MTIYIFGIKHVELSSQISNINWKFKFLKIAYFKKKNFIILLIQHFFLQNSIFLLIFNWSFEKFFLLKSINYFKGKIVLQLKIANFFVCLKIIISNSVPNEIVMNKSFSNFQKTLPFIKVYWWKVCFLAAYDLHYQMIGKVSYWNQTCMSKRD